MQLDITYRYLIGYMIFNRFEIYIMNITIIQY